MLQTPIGRRRARNELTRLGASCGERGTARSLIIHGRRYRDRGRVNQPVQSVIQDFWGIERELLGLIESGLQLRLVIVYSAAYCCTTGYTPFVGPLLRLSESLYPKTYAALISSFIFASSFSWAISRSPQSQLSTF